MSRLCNKLCKLHATIFRKIEDSSISTYLWSFSRLWASRLLQYRKASSLNIFYDIALLMCMQLLFFLFWLLSLFIFRYEAFNSNLRAQNVFGNRHSPSKDIAHKFAVLENLRFVCNGGYYGSSSQYSRYLIHSVL